MKFKILGTCLALLITQPSFALRFIAQSAGNTKSYSLHARSVYFESSDQGYIVQPNSEAHLWFTPDNNFPFLKDPWIIVSGYGQSFDDMHYAIVTPKSTDSDIIVKVLSDGSLDVVVQ